MEWKWDSFYERVTNWLAVQGPKIIIGIIVLLIGLWVVKWVGNGLKKVLEKKKFNSSLRYFLLNLVVITLQILVIFLAMQVAGIQLTFFAAIVAGLSVAAGLALSGTLQNFVSGILILVLKPYRVGDRVIVQNQQGLVTSILLFYTLVVTDDNKTIIVPNAQLSNNVVVNLSKEGRRRIDLELKFSYKTDLELLKQTIRDAFRSCAAVLDSPEPFIVIENLEADKFTLVAHAWCVQSDYLQARLTVNETVMEALKSKQLIG